MPHHTERKEPPTALSAVPDLERLISQLIGYPLVLSEVTPPDPSVLPQPAANTNVAVPSKDGPFD